MIREFDSLSSVESELVMKSPLLVCILIAGADGVIDNKEMNAALLISKEQHRFQSILSAFFLELSEDFEDKLKILIQSYPLDTHQRNAMLVEELAGLNSIWPKLNNQFAVSFYDMLKKLAHRIATSSGGIWGINAIGPEEARFIELPMLENPFKD